MGLLYRAASPPVVAVRQAADGGVSSDIHRPNNPSLGASEAIHGTLRSIEQDQPFGLRAPRPDSRDRARDFLPPSWNPSGVLIWITNGHARTTATRLPTFAQESEVRLVFRREVNK